MASDLDGGQQPTPAGKPASTASLSAISDNELAERLAENRRAITRDLEQGEGREFVRLFHEQMDLLREKARRLRARMP